MLKQADGNVQTALNPDNIMKKKQNKKTNFLLLWYVKLPRFVSFYMQNIAAVYKAVEQLAVVMITNIQFLLV